MHSVILAVAVQLCYSLVFHLLLLNYLFAAGTSLSAPVAFPTEPDGIIPDTLLCLVIPIHLPRTKTFPRSPHRQPPKKCRPHFRPLRPLPRPPFQAC